MQNVLQVLTFGRTLSTELSSSAILSLLVQKCFVTYSGPLNVVRMKKGSIESYDEKISSG